MYKTIALQTGRQARAHILIEVNPNMIRFSLAYVRNFCHLVVFLLVEAILPVGFPNVNHPIIGQASGAFPNTWEMHLTELATRLQLAQQKRG
jgi:hypothetical protein